MILLIVMVESALFPTLGVHWFMWVATISLWKTSDNSRIRLLNRSLFLQVNTHYRSYGHREKNISGI